MHHADISNNLQYTCVDVIDLLNLCHQNKLNTYNIYIFGKFHESTKFNNSGKIINKFIIEKNTVKQKNYEKTIKTTPGNTLDERSYVPCMDGMPDSWRHRSSVPGIPRGT